MEPRSYDLNDIRAIVRKPSVRLPVIDLDPDATRQVLSALVSAESLKSLKADPYLPKWNSPWWHLLILWETGAIKRVPEAIVQLMLKAIDGHYLKTFPFTEAEIPFGIDPVRNIMCHCALGSIYQVFKDFGIDIDTKASWMREWFPKYQQEDGGLNCDEAAYTGSHKSSIVSTLPPLEAMLGCAKQGLTKEEVAFLDAGAKYLIQRRLFRGVASGEVMDETWLQLCFPRFYHYDVLRGVSFLTNWALTLERALPLESIGECLVLIDKKIEDGWLYTERAPWLGAPSRVYDKLTHDWVKGESKSFALLDSLGKPGRRSEGLTMQWNAVKSRTAQLIQKQLIS